MNSWDDARRVVLSLGSNLGQRMDNLQGALDVLFDARGLRFVAASPVYETAPVGGPEQGAYLNAIVLADTLLGPRTLLERAQSVEEAFDRVRDIHWGPRTLDVDIITYGDETSDDPTLTLPHPRAHERAFVLRPWADVDPEARLTGRGPVLELLRAVRGQEVRRRDDLVLQVPD
ncbi:2-amino-4-hydroxy-6-hydroxymethyldihydropteridine diphosphokinase [Marinitenerispora sediminis]|uniref:2-amino-4-hydroxy-6-hydroxymethyldihydropteridine diphosphokinase n=1 Tax=Marinitenerispora sediminis TaxID=1931232 RepID=A0A368T9I0_9ACTN|nr:2-amino-4-hydroxy-6-hydroxymethyldihydropteridine diphosphokinase [Marinitenerispora sediminis]RCV55157.1 2-amino-4-hydroxy-6-hydroxymethyldihydropteridine diphosphokinase [Marinitenerispora sediminis]RCV61243.1 2-amino-4-hydroxy-6-hydroxymethyldihydropteridine diphosphokinase [Marinitenerispora sediminis]RCV61514.1 2-amino-4-hydroxy-6-hydroxymethyldihydropteridine diphosphokinase [Marinitenerispora sediminis]